MSLPYFPFYPKDYEAKTTHLTLAEDGAYIRLLRLSWVTPGCTLPDDDAWIRRHMRASEAEFASVIRPVLDEFFVRKGGRIINPPLLEIYHESSLAHSKRILAGAKGGKAKAANHNEKTSSNATAMLKQPEPEPEPYKKEDTIVSLSDPAFDLFNEFAARAGWPACQKRTKPRASAIIARVKEAGGLDGWRVALEKAEASDFLCNRTRTAFTASIDFLLQASSFAKLMEGNYDNRKSANPAPAGSGAFDKLVSGFAAAVHKQQH